MNAQVSTHKLAQVNFGYVLQPFIRRLESQNSLLHQM